MSGDPPSRSAGSTRIPVVEEQLRVAKQAVVTGRVRVETTVEHHSVPVREMLSGVEVRVERVAIDRLVDPGEVPAVRREADRVVVPVYEEVLVKQIRIIEELHLVTVQREREFEEDVDLRRTDVVVTRD